MENAMIYEIGKGLLYYPIVGVGATTGFGFGAYVGILAYTAMFAAVDRIFKPTDPHLTGPIIGGLVYTSGMFGVIGSLFTIQKINQLF